MPPEFRPDPPAGTRWPLLVFPLAKLVLHLVTHAGYGVFRDELYYLACAKRLAWGYVDQPPLSILLLRIQTELFGDSLFALRLLPAVAGALAVLVVGLIARRLGGGAFAQALAMLAALVAPVYLALHHFYSMNALDVLFWALAAYLLLRIVQGGDPRLWLLLGAVLGLGLQNKISVLWLGLGLAAGLLLSAHRRVLLSAWPWAGGALALAIFSPHLLWQAAHDWPTLEFIRNATANKMVEVAPLDFVGGQILAMGPLSLPVWLAGLVFCLRRREARPLGWTYLTVFTLLVLSGSSRAAYLAPTYTWLFAAGGVALERLADRLAPRRGPRRWPRWAAAGLLAAGGAATAPLALPVLPVDSYVRYAERLGVAPSTAERKELAELPQFYADMHGWREIVDQVAAAWATLPAEDRERARFFTFNYGDAGAIEYYGRAYGLPPALSGHNSYWLWGPGDSEGEVMIVLGDEREDLERSFASVERAGTTDCGYCMPYENNRPIWICRQPLRPLSEVWPRLKHYD